MPPFSKYSCNRFSIYRSGGGAPIEPMSDSSHAMSTSARAIFGQQRTQQKLVYRREHH